MISSLQRLQAIAVDMRKQSTEIDKAISDVESYIARLKTEADAAGVDKVTMELWESALFDVAGEMARFRRQ